jgi:aspartate oxidase
MVLWFHKKEEKPKKKEVEEIKKKVEEGFSSLELEEKIPLPEQEVPQKQTSTPTPSYAPIFIKLEKYESIIRRIERLEELLRDMREILRTNDEVERIRKEIHTLLAKNLQEVSRIVGLLDRDLVRPSIGAHEAYREEEFPQSSNVEELEAHVSELKKQLEELKRYF